MGMLLEVFESSNIHPMWKKWIEPDYNCMWALKELDAVYTKGVSNGKRIFPEAGDIFKAFEMNPADVRCIILGQDPYHEAGEAMGLAFSVPNGTKCPPSLRNIKKEIATDIGDVDLSGTDLTPWMQQGVLLLNTVLTVEEGKANSHAKLGWEYFVRTVLDYLYKDYEEPIVAILWGAHAQKIGSDIENLAVFRPVKAIKSVHPSPLSANRGFFGSRPFSQANEFLVSHGSSAIDWSIPG